MRKVIKIGGSLGVTIPKSQLKKYGVEEGDEMLVVLVRRSRKLSDELSGSEMNEFHQFLKWKKKEKKSIDDAVNALKNTQ